MPSRVLEKVVNYVGGWILWLTGRSFRRNNVLKNDYFASLHGNKQARHVYE